MKFIFFISSFIFVFSAYSYNYPQKIYFQLETLQIDESGLYLNDNGITYLIPGITKDNKGWCFYTSGVKWICDRCGRVNDMMDDDYCQGCRLKSPFN